jgi:uncharacterized protein
VKNMIFKELKQVFEKGTPLARLIKNSSGYYLYDTGTNKILECNQNVFSLLNDLMRNEFDRAVTNFIDKFGESNFFDAAGEILDAISNEKILSAQKATGFGLSDHFRNLKDVLKSSVMGINLEVTEQCNLRCVYCIYQDHVTEKRNYGSKEMSLDMAHKAIDFLKSHSVDNKKVSIGFYGGEPLMRFDFMRQSVAYANQIFTGEQEITFNVTTNATLITGEIADFLASEDFVVTVSLDGPREYHDRFRLDTLGNGSFARTIQGMKLLTEKFKQYGKGNLLINVVYTPPFNMQKLDAVNQFIEGLEWLPSNVHVNTTYPSDNSIPQEYVSQDDLEEERFLFDWAIDNYKDDFNQSDSVVKGQIEERFSKFIKRSVLNEPVDAFMLNGCCVPGQKKNYITVDGYILACEKMPGNSPPLGHVESGFDFETIEKVYIEEYSRKSLERCAQCWGLRLCDVCYLYAFNDEGELDMEKKSRHCRSVMQNVENTLCHFVTLLKANPEKLDYLYHFDII